MGIFIKKLAIQNYKCFENESINLRTPNGQPGSGLNILIGENGNGKTTVLESINYLTLNSFSAENKISINDFYDFKEEIVIEAETDDFSCSSSSDYYKDWNFNAKGVSFKAKSRNIKERGNLLSGPFQINNNFITYDNYIKKDGSQGKEIDGRDRIFSKSRINDEEELNIFFFDKNRTRQISKGNYKTTFEKICDDLNWNFVKNLSDENINAITQNITGEYFKTIEKITNKNVGKKTASDLKDFFEKDEFNKIKIELLNLLHPFTNSFFALRNENDLTQVSVADLGSGVEIILTLLMLRNIAGVSKGSIIYLIDEPELHLHPKAQEKLLNLLLEESKKKQIIVSTHSPYLFKGAISQNANLILFTRDLSHKIQISDVRDKGWGIFPWSPSWGEINFFAYSMPTIEFHDELFGYLHELYIGEASNQTDADKRSSLNDFEKSYLQSKLSTTKQWTKEFGGISQSTDNVTISTFIRNKAHHPENKAMQAQTYSDQELKDSIEGLINILRNP